MQVAVSQLFNFPESQKNQLTATMTAIGVMVVVNTNTPMSLGSPLIEARTR